MRSDIVLFESADGEVSLPVAVDRKSGEVWPSRQLLGRDVKTIGKHVGNALREELAGSDTPTVAKYATVQLEGNREVTRQVEHYSLDVALSVGYRVKSRRGVEFRRWASGVLRSYVVEGRAENSRRLEQLAQVAESEPREKNVGGTGPRRLEAACALLTEARGRPRRKKDRRR